VEHEGPGSGPVGATEELVRQYAALRRRRRMKGIYMKEIDPLALRGVGWVGKAALFCSGLLAMVALIIVTVVLTAVMLTVTALPAAAVKQKREVRGRRDSTNTSEISAAHQKAVAS
jgi:hypothetical protein